MRELDASSGSTSIRFDPSISMDVTETDENGNEIPAHATWTIEVTEKTAGILSGVV